MFLPFVLPSQTYHQLRGSYILACAPSNSAADLIATRLLTGGTPIAKTSLMRINAQSRDWKTVDEILKVKRKLLKIC